jgi:hypothetical protein
MSFTPDSNYIVLRIDAALTLLHCSESRYVGLKAGQAYGMHPVPDDTTGYL